MDNNLYAIDFDFLDNPNPTQPTFGSMDSGDPSDVNSTASANTTEFEYIYDYDSDIPLAELAPVTFVYGLTLVLGLVGNGLVIFTIVRIRRMQSVTNIFLTSLASADLLLILICVPIKVSFNNKISDLAFM